MAGTQGDTLSTHIFQVELGGVSVESVQEVSGLTVELDTIEVAQVTPSGQYIIKKIPGARKGGEVTITRGMDKSTAFTQWIVETFEKGNVTAARKNISIIFVDATNTPFAPDQPGQRLGLQVGGCRPQGRRRLAGDREGHRRVRDDQLRMKRRTVAAAPPGPAELAAAADGGADARLGGGLATALGAAAGYGLTGSVQAPMPGLAGAPNGFGVPAASAPVGPERIRTEFEFELPRGYVDASGTVHRTGAMRLATARDELIPLIDVRVKENAAYLTVVLLGLVITRIGTVTDVHAGVVERLFASDLAFLQDFYRRINAEGHTRAEVSCPTCHTEFEVDLAGSRLGES